MAGLATMVQGFVLTKETISLYDSSLSKYGYIPVAAAIKRIAQERNGRDPFPAIRDIAEILDPDFFDPSEKANILAGEIIGTIAAIGPYRIEDAKRRLGSDAWELIEGEGGWKTICEMVTNENAPIYKAQWRESLKVRLKRTSRKELRDLLMPPEISEITSAVFKKLPYDKNKKESREMILKDPETDRSESED